MILNQELKDGSQSAVAEMNLLIRQMLLRHIPDLHFFIRLIMDLAGRIQCYLAHSLILRSIIVNCVSGTGSAQMPVMMVALWKSLKTVRNGQGYHCRLMVIMVH